jgi:hypothetical protein
MSKAPAILKGIQSQDNTKLLSEATSAQIQALSCSNFALWCATSGVKIDGKPFDFDGHRYMLPMYLDDNRDITLAKAAQMGATSYLLLRLVWFTRFHQIKAGLFFPTSDAVRNLSKDRLGPMFDAHSDLRASLVDHSDSLALKQIRNIHGGISSLYMLYLGGQASKDSVPLDMIAFDEVRLVSETDVDQALERISHSSYKYKLFMSTMSMPNRDIDKRFQQGKQFYWHVICRCPDGFIPSDVFPDCIVDSGSEVYLRCPRCKTRIVDPQNGRYIAHNPKAEANSYHISQLISKFISPKEIWEVYKKTSNKKEFYNAKLGRAWVDAENQPVTDMILESSVNNDLKWSFEMTDKEKKKGIFAMGVDQHFGNVYVVIMKKGPDGKHEICHFEVVDRGNPRYYENGTDVTPFKRLYELMTEFNIGICIIDAQPNINEAQDFCRYFPGRAFMAFYGESGQDQIKWMDRVKHKETVRKGGKEIKLKWQCMLNRYQSLDMTLRMFGEGMIKMPPPSKLVQVVLNPESNRFEAEDIVKTRLWEHLKSMVRQREVVNEDTGKERMTYIYTGRDPHSTHAVNFCMHAMGRAKRLPIFTF